MRPRSEPGRTRPAAALLLAALVTACDRPPYPRGTLDELYPQAPRPTLSTAVVQGHALRLAQMAGPGAAATPLLFVHGSPGDWQAWARYLDAPPLTAYGPRIAVDRPGFGGSGPGAVIVDLRRQAAVLAGLLPPDRRSIVVGHSLGGALVAWLALDYPDRVCGAVSVSGSLAAAQEAPRWYNRLADTVLARALLPGFWLASNREMLGLQDQLRALERALPTLQRPLIAIQGDADALVNPATVDDLARHVPPARLEVVHVPGQGHFVVWDRMDLVIAAVQHLDCQPPLAAAMPAVRPAPAGQARPH